MQRGADWSYDAPVYISFDNITTYKQVDGVVEVWRQTTDEHPWKERDFAPVLRCRLSVEEAAAEILAIEQDIADRQKAADAANNSKAEITAYFAALPLVIGGYDRGGADRFGRENELYDSYGNYIMSLPNRAGIENWALDALVEYVRNNDYCE